MRAGGTIACGLVLLSAGAAAGQRVEVTLPDWCTEGGGDVPSSTARVSVRTDLEEVFVDDVRLARRGRDGEREGDIDLVPHVATRSLLGAVGDIELGVVAMGREGLVSKKVICRLHRTAMEVAERPLAAAAGKANRWARRYQPRSEAEPAVVLVAGTRALAFRRRGWVTYPDEMWTTPTFQLADLELIARERSRRIALDRCPSCALDDKDDRYPCRRSRDVTTVQVFEAASGRLLATKVFHGDEPPPCFEGMTFPVAEGGPVPPERIFEWIRETF